jgi:hypothetical protein
LALAMTAAGCGGDDTEAGDYREKASSLCDEAKREAESISPPKEARMNNVLRNYTWAAVASFRSVVRCWSVSPRRQAGEGLSAPAIASLGVHRAAGPT